MLLDKNGRWMHREKHYSVCLNTIQFKIRLGTQDEMLYLFKRTVIKKTVLCIWFVSNFLVLFFKMLTPFCNILNANCLLVQFVGGHIKFPTSVVRIWKQQSCKSSINLSNMRVFYIYVDGFGLMYKFIMKLNNIGSMLRP